MNMTPYTSENNGGNGCVRYTKLPRKLRFTYTCRSSFTYISDLIGTKFRTGRSFASCLSFLLAHVCGVLSRGAKEKMRWVYTNRIVTGMANKESFWNWAIYKHPGCTMWGGVTDKWIKPENTVDHLLWSCSFPDPAGSIIALFNLVPESFGQGHCGCISFLCKVGFESQAFLFRPFGALFASHI